MLLAVDTSTRFIGVALYDGFRVLSEVSWLSGNHHTVELGPVVFDTLNRAGVKQEELGAVAVAIGPGSFTGLRIGLSLAKGLAISRRLSIIGIPTLDALAAAQPLHDRMLAAVLEAGRGRLAVGWYQVEEGQWKSTGVLENQTTDDFIERIKEPMMICGELGYDFYHQISGKWKDVVILSPAQSLRRPAFLAELAWKRWKNGDVDDLSTLKPIYLHYGKPIPG